MNAKALASLWACILVSTPAASAKATQGTALFKPTAYPTQRCSFSEWASNQKLFVPMQTIIPRSQSYALGGTAGGHENALSAYPVYLIFSGPAWNQGNPTLASQFISAYKSILSSSYLAGVTQYGSVGVATYADAYVDSCTNPDTYCTGSTCATATCQYPPDNEPSAAWYEIHRALVNDHADCPNARYQTWANSAGQNVNGIYDASNSAIFVVLYYWDKSPCGAGVQNSNYPGRGPNGNYVPPVNVIDQYMGPSPILATATPLFSHELVERMSTGTGQLAQCTYATQIADGEPDDVGYEGFVGSQLVQAYWSVMDQAFIIPGATIAEANPDASMNLDNPVARTFIRHVWDANGDWVSLRDGNLARVNPGQSAPTTATLVDTNVVAYTADENGTLYDLTTSGQVRQFNTSLTTPTPITGTATNASAIIAPRAANPCAPYKGGVVGNGLYMVASNNGAPSQVWYYTGQGTNWTQLTNAPPTTLDGSPSFAAVTTGQCTQAGHDALWYTSLYMIANNGGQDYVWTWNSGTNWSQVTGAGTISIQSIVGLDGRLFMMASNGSGYEVWQYLGSGTDWARIWRYTDGVAYKIWAAGNLLMMTTVSGQIWQFVPPGDGSVGSTIDWTFVTGSATTYVDQAVQDDIELFLLGNNGGGDQVFEFQGIGSVADSTTGWAALTQTSTYLPWSIGLSSSDILEMELGRPGYFYWLSYQGSPNKWQ